MNSQERIQKRIERDKEKRAQRKVEKNAKIDDIEKVITSQHYNTALKKCRAGVMWKGVPQKYCQQAITNMYNTSTQILKGEIPKIKNARTSIRYERGKAREIIPVQFDDRITQRVICDDSLMPLIKDTLIYDNVASIKGKGTDFARQEMEKFLRKAMREYGDEFYVWKFDFKSYFDSIPHSTIQKVLNEYYTDPKMIKLIMGIVKMYKIPYINKIQDKDERKRELKKLENNELCGICLGSQISQDVALVVPNKIDHFIKDKCRFKYYIRYMDDGIVLFNDKNTLQQLYNQAKEICKELGLEFNANKTHVIKITKGFTFLKVRYKVKDGRLIKTLSKDGIVRMRRKLKKYKKKVDNGEMTLDDVYNSFQSWISHSSIAMSYKTVKRMLSLYDEIFDGYKITRKYFNIINAKGGRKNEVLQSDKWSEFRWTRDNGKYAYYPEPQ